jgi:hypothetical protein
LDVFHHYMKIKNFTLSPSKHEQKLKNVILNF